MKLIKIIIDHTQNKIFGQSETREGGRTVKEYTGFNSVGQEAKKVKETKEITIYDLRL
jgi:hypothetical protein